MGAALPGDAACAAVSADPAEIRSANATYNRQPAGASRPPPGGVQQRATGNFTGTTDEIIQWTACKWGIDEDVDPRPVSQGELVDPVDSGGDFTTQPPLACASPDTVPTPLIPVECPESIGMQQVRYAPPRGPSRRATNSTAFNLDAAYGYRRNCFEGNDTWLEHGRARPELRRRRPVGLRRDVVLGPLVHAAGDDLHADVKDYLNQRIWTWPEFINFTG